MYCLRLALTFDNLGFVSTIKIKNNVFYFVLSSTCTNFATMKKIAVIIWSVFLPCFLMNAQDDSMPQDTSGVEPIVTAELHGARQATEEEKEYARMLAKEREEQQQIDSNLPLVSENGQVMTHPVYYHPYYGPSYDPVWHLHKGLNVNVGASVFATTGGGHSGAGFGQDISLMYVTNLSRKATLAIGGYFNNTIWDGDNYTTAGISAMLGYRFDEHWSAYAFVQKAMNSGNVRPSRYWGMGAYGYYPYYAGFGSCYGGYDNVFGSNPSRYMDRFGAGVRYEWGENSFVQIQLEVDRMPENGHRQYDTRRYDYPVR